MLEVYIEKEFFEKYHLAFENRDDLRYDFQFNFLRKLRNCVLYTNYSNFKELADDNTKNPLLELMIDSVPKVEYDHNLSETIGNIEFVKSGSPFKIILSCQSDEICIEYRKKFGLEYLNTSNLAERWSLHAVGRDDALMRTTFKQSVAAESRFDSWDKFKPFRHPINSVLIIDLYLLNWKEERHLTSNLKNNIYPLLSNLLFEASSEIKLDITFFVQFDSFDQEDKMKTTFKKINEFIQKQSQSGTEFSFDLNFIDYEKKNLNSEDQNTHDRTIITNSFLIESGAGFSIFSIKKFKIDGNDVWKPFIHHNSFIHFLSLFPLNRHNTVLSDLISIQEYVSGLDERDKSTNKLNYYKSKTNRLLQN